MVDNDKLTVAEAAELSGYTGRHITRLVKQGRVNGQRVGLRVYLVDRESLLAYVLKMQRAGRERHAG